MKELAKNLLERRPRDPESSREGNKPALSLKRASHTLSCQLEKEAAFPVPVGYSFSQGMKGQGLNFCN